MDLNKYVQEVSLQDFGKEFRHVAIWNRRLRSTGGRFFPRDGHLDFNPKHLEEQGLEVFRKIVRHELCHYHLERLSAWGQGLQGTAGCGGRPALCSQTGTSCQA